MRRFFVESQHITHRQATLSGDSFRHAVKVLRLGKGDEIRIFDESGHEYQARISQVGKQQLTAEITRRRRPLPEPAIRLTIMPALPKADRMRWVVQKCAELGVARVVPIITERTVVRISQEEAKSRVERWRKISQEASRQCGRATVMEVDSPLPLSQAVGLAKRQGIALAAYEELKGEGGLWAALKEAEGMVSLALLIGPEGGFVPEEIALMRRSGIVLVSLGPRILRSETAAMATAAVIMYELGDLGVPPRAW